MNAPALGSRVTVIRGAKAYLAEITHHAGPGVFAWSVPIRGHNGTSRVIDENILWCRGWHAVNSGTVKALKVARALGPEVLDLAAADRAYIAGEMTKDAWVKNLDLWDAEFDVENSR